MDKLDLFYKEFKKMSKELNLDKKTCDVVNSIYNDVNGNTSVNFLDTNSNIFMIDSYCVLRHSLPKSIPFYFDGIFVTTFNNLRKVFGIPTFNSKIRNTSYIEWHVIVKIAYNSYSGVYVGIPIIIKYSGVFHLSDIEWTIMSGDNRAIQIVDMITCRSPTKNDFILM